MAKQKTDAGAAAKDAAKGAKGKVHLFVLMDESGSMSGLQEAVVTGCNEFLHAFRDKPDARTWVASFDEHPGEPRTRFHVRAAKGKVKDLTVADYQPRGMTPLNDAVMDALHALDGEVGKGGAFVAIITDGLENASETSAEAVAAAIAEREKRGWGFLYLGANQQAEVAAAAIGLRRRGQAMNFNATKRGVRSTSGVVGQSAAVYASAGGGQVGQAALIPFSEDLYEQTGGKLEDADEDGDE